MLCVHAHVKEFSIHCKFIITVSSIPLLILFYIWYVIYNIYVCKNRAKPYYHTHTQNKLRIVSTLSRLFLIRQLIFKFWTYLVIFYFVFFLRSREPKVQVNFSIYLLSVCLSFWPWTFNILTSSIESLCQILNC